MSYIISSFISIDLTDAIDHYRLENIVHTHSQSLQNAKAASEYIQLMKRETPFKLAAKATLRVTERQPQQDKAMVNTLKAGNDLHQQLSKAFKQPNRAQTLTHTFTSTKPQPVNLKNQQQSIAQQVAALDDFVAVVSKDKTKQLIQNIKLRRREKHIQAFDDFKEELEDYRQNLNLVYHSLENDLQQVLAIKENQLREYLTSLSDQYLIQREKEVLQEIHREIIYFKEGVRQKLSTSSQQNQRIRTDRQGLVQKRCQNLFDELVDIAFVLEEEARGISDRQKSEMQKLQEEMYGRTKQRLGDIQKKENQLFSELEKKCEELQERWKIVNEERQIQQYLLETNEADLRWPAKRSQLYQDLIKVQLANSERKTRLVANLAKEHSDTLSKANIDKWNEHLKMINQAFDTEVDAIIKKLMEEVQETQKGNNARYEKMKKRLIYIERRNIEEVGILVEERCQPNLRRNNEEAREVLKQATNYVEGADEKENKALEKLYQFMSELGKRSDEFVKKWGTLTQEYELQKAKILDSDDEIVEKLTGELNDLKQQLREALHHIKLEEVQKACFDKIDELENVYRQTHQNNKEAASKRPEVISKFVEQFQAKVAEAFSLYDQSKKAELMEMAKKECEEKATKRWQEQDKKKQEEEALALEQTKKKGGKPPATKPKDPKKAQAEMEERKKVIMQEIGLRNIQEVSTGSGSVWLAFRSLVEICTQFYKGEEDQHSGDSLGDQIANYKGEAIVTKKAMISAKDISVQLQTLRGNFFQQLGLKKARILGEAQKADNIFIEDSLSTLDSRLRQHYPLKGKLEAEVGVVRSSQITGHKKEYEKHVRICKQKMDLQTQKFNYLLQKCLQLFKDHNADQKVAKESLSKGKTLSDFQGSYRKAHQNFKFFSRQIQEIGHELSRLSLLQVESIIRSNEDFLKKSKLLAEGGEFSTSEAEWYNQMMTEINDQITQQKQKRAEKSKEVQEESQKRSKELIEAFDKEYANYLEDLSAREGTGKKYGKPRRIAQEKIRFEMNKCEQAQINIDQQIDRVLDICHNGPPHYPQKPTFIQWRQKLMTLQTCIVRYAKHIEATVPNCKARNMPRVTRLEGISDALLTPEQEEEDKKKLMEQISELGPLSQQKEDKSFMKYLDDIEKIIGDEARAVYTGDKAKYITGNDKLPDFLRAYIGNMRKNAEEFRQESVRKLRESCNKFASSASQIVELFFGALDNYFISSQTSLCSSRKKEIDKIIIAHSKIREEHLVKLRPNLSHPSCQNDLKELDLNQKKRQEQFDTEIKQQQKILEDDIFNNSSQFLYATLNNYEMLILLFDSLYLHQDFAKVAGDDAEEKVHLDAKRLMLMKQKGISIDANSERNLRKKWEGVNCTLFNFGDKKFTNVVKSAEQPKQKDKKASKKDTKAKVQQSAPVNPDVSKVIDTFKTWRQKSVFTSRQQTISHFHKQYQKYLSSIGQQVALSLKENDSFKLKWSAIAKPLYIS